jgi:aspartate/methionine/tyrosine aminotransferase
MRVHEAASARANRGLPMFNLATGQPSTPAPAGVRAAAHRALDNDLIGYTAARGVPELRAAIAEHYRRIYALDVNPDEVVVTTGASGSFLLSFLAAFDVGDVVAVARPGYPAYRNMLTALGCRVVELACGPDSRFQLTVAMLEAMDPVPAGVVVASPANPTGTVMKPSELAVIGAWCDRHGVRLISDEIYHGISYVGPTACAWESRRDAIVVNSFSKYFSMTGWRLGWLLAPRDLVDSIDRISTNLTLCPPTLSQSAAVAAFDDYAELDANVAEYFVNRDLVLSRLAQLGLHRVAPADGAFYVYADLSDYTDNSLMFCHRMLDEIGVSVAPGRRLRHPRRWAFRSDLTRRRTRRPRRCVRHPFQVAAKPAAAIVESWNRDERALRQRGECSTREIREPAMGCSPIPRFRR